jgi:hypothetical protein
MLQRHAPARLTGASTRRLPRRIDHTCRAVLTRSKLIVIPRFRLPIVVTTERAWAPIQLIGSETRVGVKLQFVAGKTPTVHVSVGTVLPS